MTGLAAAHGRTAINAKQLGDGHYTIELHRGTEVRMYELGYTTTDGGVKAYTINDSLELTEGCTQ